ncbi:MAG: hypothetical protein HY917_04465 [Candidatus Diapherotrites archaeon]|nr:hypothetical protein [Candidatus Diapherotrites archaeon]
MPRKIIPREPVRRFTTDWFNPRYHQRKFPHHGTLMQQPEGKALVRQALQGLHPNPAGSAVEIGPGRAPLLAELPFREKTFVDVNPEVLKGIKTGKKVRADIRSFTLKNTTELTIINEVLTHIPPSERIKVVEALAEKSQAILIVDRLTFSHQTMREFIEYEINRSRRIELPHKPIPEQIRIEAELTQAEENWKQHAAHERVKRVDFERLEASLERKGFEVCWEIHHTIQPDEKREVYAILTAKRK